MKKLVVLFLATGLIGFTAYSQEGGEKNGWTATDRGPFITECVKSAKAGMSEDSAKYYCYCMLEKVEKIYPDPTKATAVLNKNTLSSPEWKKIIMACMGAYWPAADRKDFMSSCIASATPSIGETKAASYCECMMYKIERRYPNINDANKITEETLSSPEFRALMRSCVE